MIESTIPMTTPASTPNVSTLMRAAIAHPEVESFHPKNRRIAGMLDHAEHNGVDDHRGSTALGKSENNGARNSIVNTTTRPVTKEDIWPAPDWSLSELAERLVATGSLGPCQTPRDSSLSDGLD